MEPPTKPREWNIFVLPSMHQDISYTLSAEDGLQLYVDEYLKYLDLMDAEPSWCYSSEYAFSVRHFLDTHPEEKERITRYVQAGRFGITAQCSGFDPSFYTGEFVIREIATAKHWLRDTFGYEPRTLHIADCPDFMPQLPQILQGCEVDLFLCDRIGSGEGRGGNVLHISEYPGMWERLDNEMLKSIVGRMGTDQERGELAALYSGYWEWKREHKNDQPVSRLWRHVGLDGSPVLAYAPSARYYGLWGLEVPANEKLKGRFGVLHNEEQYLSNLDADVEPAYTALGIAGFDEKPIHAAEVVRNVAAWNRDRRTERGIALTLSTAEQFTQRMVELVESGQFTPGQYSGITPGWHFAGYDSDDMALVQNQLPNAEMLSTLNALLGVAKYPSERFERAWEILWAVSHNQKSDPSYFSTLRDSAKRTASLLSRSLDQLTGAIKPARPSPPILVFNPLSWERTERVQVTVPTASVPGIVNTEGRAMPFTVLNSAPKADGTAESVVEFVADSVPGMGYRTFYVEGAAPTTPSDLEQGENWIQNLYFRIALDPEGYVQIEDRINGREIAGSAAASGPLRLVGEGRQGELPWKSEAVEISSSGTGLKLSIRGLISRSPATLTLTLTTESKRIDLDVDLNWDGQRGVQLYLPLPFQFEPDELHTGVASGYVPYFRPTAPALLRHAPLSRRSSKTTFSTYWYFPLPHSPIPGDDLSWAYMQKWAALGPASGNIVIASGRRNGLVVGDGVLAIPLLRTPSKRSWHVRKTRIYETGAHHWHVAFSTTQDLGQATHLGWEAAQPLLATGRWQPGGALDDTLALIELGPDAAIPMALKRSAGDDGWTLRFFESTDQDRDIQLRTHPALGLQENDLYEANLLDAPQDKLDPSGEDAAIPVHGFEIKTLLFREG